MKLSGEYLDVSLPMEKIPPFHGLLNWVPGRYIKTMMRGTLGGDKAVRQAEVHGRGACWEDAWSQGVRPPDLWVRPCLLPRVKKEASVEAAPLLNPLLGAVSFSALGEAGHQVGPRVPANLDLEPISRYPSGLGLMVVGDMEMSAGRAQIRAKLLTGRSTAPWVAWRGFRGTPGIPEITYIVQCVGTRVWERGGRMPMAFSGFSKIQKGEETLSKNFSEGDTRG